jgi:hypothetical protein
LRNDRVGLLFGLSTMMDTNVNNEWFYHEKVIIEKIEASTKELWMNYKESNEQHTLTEEFTPNTRDVLLSFIPRVAINQDVNNKHHVNKQEQRTPSPSIRTVRIKERQRDS